MAEQKHKAVVAGWKWGSLHMRAFAESDLCDLQAIWSRTENDDARAASAVYDVPLYTDFQKMLAEVQPDIASVAVPEAAHEVLTVGSLEAGCHVYCEKVLSSSKESAQRMIDAAKAANRILNVGYNYRYGSSCQYLLESVRSGKIGRPLFAHLRAYGNCMHHMADYVCTLLGKPSRAVSVIRKEPVDGKALPTPASLIFPTFMYSAMATKAFMVQFADGAILLAGSTDYSSPLNAGATLLLEGTEGHLMLDDLTGNVSIWENSRESLLYSPSQLRDTFGHRENCVTAVKDFILAVHEGREAPIPGQDGISMIHLEEAIFRSADSGNWEDVE